MCLRIFNFKFVFPTATQSAGFSIPLLKTYIRAKLAFIVSALEKSQLQRISIAFNYSLLTSVFTFEFHCLTSSVMDLSRFDWLIYFAIFQALLFSVEDSTCFEMPYAQHYRYFEKKNK